MDLHSPAPLPTCARAFIAAAGALLPPATAAAADAPAGADIVAAASRTVALVAGLLAVAILVLVALLVSRRLSGAVRETPAPPAADGPLSAAEAEERRGNFAAAAAGFDAAGEKLRAAGIYLRTRNYGEAAKIFRSEGDHLRAAQALELCGNAVAAAREYSAAGNHARAARLLQEEGRYADAAEAYRPLLGSGEVTAGNAAQHTTYAALLALAGERGRAASVYRDVLAALPGNLRAASGLQSLATRARAPGGPGPSKPPAGPIDPAPGDVDLGARAQVFTLRDMIRAGRLEPRCSMRLWVGAMRALAERHRANVVYGCLTPEGLAVDRENNVRIEATAGSREPYASPEVLAGLPPDRQADIYSMGVILYEMVTGSADQLGRRRAGEIVADVPHWLDELIGRCTEKNLTKRFRTTEEVSAALLKLKAAAAE